PHATHGNRSRPDDCMAFRSSIPPGLRRTARAAYVEMGRRSAALRPHPDFMVIGTQRGGTTSLFRALEQHRQFIRPTLNKGVNYFDVEYDRDDAWYRGHFPTKALAGRRTDGLGEPRFFEASGYYMFHPLAIERIAEDLPDVKLVAMLRDPVERAFSAWKHESARGFETETFERALELEDERLDGEIEAMRNDPSYQSFDHRHHAYRRRGDYAAQLQHVVDAFGRDHLHVVYSESFFERPAEEFGRLCEFLDASPPPSTVQYDQHNARPSTDMDDDTRAMLREHFAPLDVALTELVGERPPWSHD
ncbi:MAG: sulfotransferase, partial [Ilumatobacter sp.]